MLKSLIGVCRPMHTSMFTSHSLARPFSALSDLSISRLYNMRHSAPSVGIIPAPICRKYGESLAHRKYFFMKERRIKGTLYVIDRTAWIRGSKKTESFMETIDKKDS